MVVRHIKYAWGVVESYSLLLVLGTVIALYWVYQSPHAYHVFHNMVILEHSLVGELHRSADGSVYRVLTMHYLVKDVLMAVFFAVAGKEIWEGIVLSNGKLKGKKALVPLIATMGGMLGPVAVYLLIARFFGSEVYAEVAHGWAVPTATDIAFSLFFARFIFGFRHAAIDFLLLLAIADDGLGLGILAVFYPSGNLALEWLLVSLLAALVAYLGFNLLPRKLGLTARFPAWQRVIPFGIAGAVSWYAFQESGLHPALGLLPIVPVIPHAENDTYVFDDVPGDRMDLLNFIEHRLKGFVQVILFFFGLVSAGVEFTSVGPATWTVLGGLLLGKPIGIFLFAWIGVKVFRLGLPEGMTYGHLLIVGVAASIGFTVSLFVSDVAFEPGHVQDAAKVGALLSFVGGGIALALAMVIRVNRKTA